MEEATRKNINKNKANKYNKKRKKNKQKKTKETAVAFKCVFNRMLRAKRGEKWKRERGGGVSLVLRKP